MSIATLPALDSSLYPLTWEQQVFDNAADVLLALLEGSLTLDAKTFAQSLIANEVYQEWINALVYGRYIQLSFAAFYNQSKDSFNIGLPALFRRELMRHTRYLPLEQTLFVAGEIPESVRQEKLFTTTLNPATVIAEAKQLNEDKSASDNQQLIVNQIRVISKQVLGFPIRHNKHTSECTRNEVLILGFNDLQLIDERTIEGSNIADTTLLRSYELG